MTGLCRTGRWLPVSLCLLGACAKTSTMQHDAALPDWRGPAVHCRHLGDGGLVVELIAPTAGHAFQLQDVEVRAERADASFRYGPPTADVVAQVVTAHRIELPADRLGSARAVCIWVTGADGVRRLAVATSRP